MVFLQIELFVGNKCINLNRKTFVHQLGQLPWRCGGRNMKTGTSFGKLIFSMFMPITKIF